MIHPHTPTDALPTLPTRRPQSRVLRRLRHLVSTATRLSRKRHLMHQPVTAYPHDEAVDADEPDCLAWLPDEQSLMVYDPASETGQAWLHAAEPLDLRDWA